MNRRHSLALVLAFVVGCSGASSGGTSNGQGQTSNGSGGEQTHAAFDDAGMQNSMTTDDAGGTMATDAGVSVTSVDAGNNAYVAQPGADFPIGPLHLAPTADARNADARVDVELRADGSIYSHGQLLGQLSGRRVISPNGRELLAVATDGTVSIGGTPTRARMHDDGEVQMPTGAVLTFDDNGRPVTVGTDQRREAGPAQVAGYRNDLRRTAALLAIIAAAIGSQ